MNLRVANVIAVELAIMIAILFYLVFFRSPSSERPTSPEIGESSAEPATTLAQLSKVQSERQAMLDPIPDRPRLRQQEQQPIAAPPQYVQQVAPQAYANPVYANAAVPAEAPAYSESYEEPAAAPPDYATSDDSIAYAEPAPVLLYPAPYQIIVFSNPRPFANRHRFHSGAFTTNFPRRAASSPFHRPSGGMVNSHYPRPSAQQGFRLAGPGHR